MKLHLNLQQKAAFTIAISLWKKEEVQNQIKELFQPHSNFREAKSKWRKFTQTVVNNWEKGILPAKLEFELAHIVKMMGETIFNWCQYVKFELKEINNMDIIHWTHYGIVDETKILPLLSKNLNPSMTKEELQFNLRVRLVTGDLFHAKYLWEKLSEEDRKDSVLSCAHIVVKNFYLMDHPSMRKGYMTIRHYKKSQYAGLCVFLLSQMSPSHKKIFFNKKIAIALQHDLPMGSKVLLDVKGLVLKMLVSSWPWQEFFLPVLQNIVQYYDDKNTIDCMFLDEITRKMVNDYRVGYPLESNKYQNLFREAWCILPASTKQNVIRNITNFYFIDHLIFLNDMSTLKFILNDPAIATVRKQFMDFKTYYSQVSEAYRYKLLNWFINEIECM